MPPALVSLLFSAGAGLGSGATTVCACCCAAAALDASLARDSEIEASRTESSCAAFSEAAVASE